MLEVTYENKNIQKLCTDVKYCDKHLGTEMTNKIHLRIEQIKGSD